MQISSDAAASLTQQGVSWATYGSKELFEEKLGLWLSLLLGIVRHAGFPSLCPYVWS